MKKMGKETYQQYLPTVAKGAGIIFIGNILGKALVLVFTLIIAKYLSPRQVGLYFLGFSIVTIVSIPALLGLDSGIVRFVSLYKGENNESKIRGTVLSSLLIVIPLSLSITLILFFLSDKVATGLFHKAALSNVLKLFSLTIPFIAVSTLFLSAIQALKYMQYKVYAKDLGDSISKIIIALILLILDFKLSGVVLATLVSVILVTILSFFYINKLIPLFYNKKPTFEFKNLLSFSIPQSFSNLIVISMLYMDILLLGYFLPAKVVGIYSVAAKISMVGILVISSFNAIFAPIISDFYNKGELGILSDLFKTVTKWIFSLSFPIFLILVLLAKPILNIFGTDYVAATTVLIILCFGQLINAASGPVGLMIVMSGRPTLELISNITVFILNIILNVLLIPKYGIQGAAISTAISISTMNIVRLLAVRLIMNIHPYKLSFYKPLLAGIIPSLVVFYLVAKAGGVGFSISGLLFIASAFVLFYLLFLYILGIESEDRLIIKAAVEKLPSWIPINKELDG